MKREETLIDKIIREKLIINKANLEYCAENEIINGFLLQSIRDAMQAYHESKLRESKIVESFERENQYVTDEDIKDYADKWFCINMLEWQGFIEGAKLMRDGEIKHVSGRVCGHCKGSGVVKVDEFGYSECPCIKDEQADGKIKPVSRDNDR